jgi:hypothetical protein
MVASSFVTWAPATTRRAPTTGNVEPWTISGEKWEALNELSLKISARNMKELSA